MSLIKNTNITIDKYLLEKVYTNRNLTSAAIRAFLLLLDHLDIEEYRPLPRRKDMAGILDISQQGVTDCLCVLVNENMIESIGDSARKFGGDFRIVYRNRESDKKLKKLLKDINELSDIELDILKTNIR